MIKNKIMKAFTDISQSKKLAEILPLENADMGWNVFVDGTTRILPINDWDLVKDGIGNVKFYPAWSLAALLNILPYPSLLKTFSGWRCDSYYKEGNTCMLGESADNQIDACYEMIIRLHELNLL